MGPGAGSGQDKGVILDGIDKKPVRLDMTFPEAGIIARQQVVPELLIQRFFHQQGVDDPHQAGQVIAAFFDALVVLSELAGGH